MTAAALAFELPAALEAHEPPEARGLARVDAPAPLPEVLARHGHPIRCGYVPREWPLSAYQTAYAREPGSTEMPSAGRPFTVELITRLAQARNKDRAFTGRRHGVPPV